MGSGIVRKLVLDVAHKVTATKQVVLRHYLGLSNLLASYHSWLMGLLHDWWWDLVQSEALLDLS